jgi:hypothetical protein
VLNRVRVDCFAADVLAHARQVPLNFLDLAHDQLTVRLHVGEVECVEQFNMLRSEVMVEIVIASLDHLCCPVREYVFVTVARHRRNRKRVSTATCEVSPPGYKSRIRVA